MPLDFNDIFSNLTSAVSKAAIDSVREYAGSAEKDGLKFLESSKTKLKTWIGLLETGDLTTEDFKILVNSQKDLMKMELLKQKGISKIKLNKAKNSIIEAVIKTGIEYIPKVIK